MRTLDLDQDPKALSSIFFHIFFVSVLLQVLNVGILSTKMSASMTHKNFFLAACTFVFQIPQVLLMLYGNFTIMRYLNYASLKDSMFMYVSTILGFAGLYFAVTLFFPTSFESQDPLVFQDTPVSFFVTMIYMSVQAQTLTGVGDFSPVGIVSESISTVQMLMGICYSVFIIAHTQSLFNNYDHVNLLSSQDSRKQSTGFGRCWDCVSKNAAIRALRLFTRRYLLLISLSIYFCNIVLLKKIHPKVYRNQEYRVSIIAMECIFQFLQITTVLATSWKYTRHIEEISINFLMQAFISTCVTFSGIYNVFWTFTSKSDPCFSLPLTTHNNGVPFTTVIEELFFFSVGTQTSTGFGNVYPRKWYTRLLVCLQMLVSILFTMVIFGRGVSTLLDRRAIELHREGGIRMYPQFGEETPIRVRDGHQRYHQTGFDPLQPSSKYEVRNDFEMGYPVSTYHDNAQK
eukprot:g479.t1